MPAGLFKTSSNCLEKQFLGFFQIMGKFLRFRRFISSAMDIVIKKQLDILIQLAKIDQDYADEERIFIENVAGKYGITHQQLKEIENNPRSIGSLGALSVNQKLEYLINVLFLTKADGKVLPEEILFCQDIAIRLGFKKVVIDTLLTITNDTTIEQINITDLKKKIENYF